MKRVICEPRENWQSKLEGIGFGFHTTTVDYWKEDKYYVITMTVADAIHAATENLWEMCIGAVQYVIDNKMYDKFHIPEYMHQHIEDSWNNDVPAIYGRFDLVVKNGQIKMLEFNADTPTSLFEAAVVQWEWLQDVAPDKDQFNSIHESLIDYWKYLKEYMHDDTVYFACARNTLEDLTTTEYMRDTATQAGLVTEQIYIDELGWDGKEFTDLSEKPIKNIFKLYPWEWIINEEFGENVPKTDTIWIEPSWKMLMSNKAILAILWELYPDSPYLLRTQFNQQGMSSYAKKPLLAREGANVTLVENDKIIEETKGEYGEEGYVFQELCKLPEFEQEKTLVGSWVVGQKSVGIGFRTSNSFISDDRSRFVPHLIED